jgi:hypothetical protein
LTRRVRGFLAQEDQQYSPESGNRCFILPILRLSAEKEFRPHDRAFGTTLISAKSADFDWGNVWATDGP